MNNKFENSINIYELANKPQDILETQFSSSELKEYLDSSPLKDFSLENFKINDFKNLNENSWIELKQNLNIETGKLDYIISKYPLTDEDKAQIKNLFEDYLFYFECFTFCQSNIFQNNLTEISRTNKKIKALNKINKIKQSNDIEINASKEDLELLNQLPYFNNFISPYLKLPSGKKGNMVLNIFIFELNAIGKRYYADNLAKFLIPVLKELKSEFPDQFKDISKFSKEYLLKRARDWKNTDNLEKLKELDKRHGGPGDIIL